MKKFKAQVRVANLVTTVNIDAPNIVAAKKLLEAQYGKGKVFGVVQIKSG